jgi:hypothetical protein
VTLCGAGHNGRSDAAPKGTLKLCGRAAQAAEGRKESEDVPAPHEERWRCGPEAPFGGEDWGCYFFPVSAPAISSLKVERPLGPMMLMVSQWCTILSTAATVVGRVLNTLPQSE